MILLIEKRSIPVNLDNPAPWVEVKRYTDTKASKNGLAFYHGVIKDNEQYRERLIDHGPAEGNPEGWQRGSLINVIEKVGGKVRDAKVSERHSLRAHFLKQVPEGKDVESVDGQTKMREHAVEIDNALKGIKPV